MARTLRGARGFDYRSLYIHLALGEALAPTAPGRKARLLAFPSDSTVMRELRAGRKKDGKKDTRCPWMARLRAKGVQGFAQRVLDWYPPGFFRFVWASPPCTVL